MKEGQKAIYYVTADTHAAAANSPHLEIFRKKGIEVLLLSDRVDEWVVTHLTEFDGKPLASVAKGGLDLGKLEDEAEKKENEQEAKELEGLVTRIKTSLGDRVKDVRITHRLTESPACLVADAHDMLIPPNVYTLAARVNDWLDELHAAARHDSGFSVLREGS